MIVGGGVFAVILLAAVTAVIKRKKSGARNKSGARKKSGARNTFGEK